MGEKKKFGDLILQIARQTWATEAKEGQLLCIPDEVATSASGENKHELYAAQVYRWQIKPPASRDARTSGLCCACEGSVTTCAPLICLKAGPFVMPLFILMNVWPNFNLFTGEKDPVKR